MKINLDFSSYKGTTKLREWWRIVKEHIEKLQDAHNNLDSAVTTENTERVNADLALSERINSESEDRSAGDAEISKSMVRKSVSGDEGIGDLNSATEVGFWTVGKDALNAPITITDNAYVIVIGSYKTDDYSEFDVLQILYTSECVYRRRVTGYDAHEVYGDWEQLHNLRFIYASGRIESERLYDTFVVINDENDSVSVMYGDHDEDVYTHGARAEAVPSKRQSRG